MDSEFFETLLQRIRRIQSVMGLVATSQARIQESEEEYVSLFRDIGADLRTLEGAGVALRNPNAFRSLWDWYSYWKATLPTYESRRTYVRRLYEPILAPIEESLADARLTGRSSVDLLSQIADAARAAPQISSATTLDMDSLHPKVVERCKAPFESKRFDDAIFNALKTVEEEIRARTAADPTDLGVALVSKAMSPRSPQLVISRIEAEQEAAHSLFRGAIGSFKNPLSHRFLDTADPVKTFEVLALSSLLMRMLDEAKLEGATTMAGKPPIAARPAPGSAEERASAHRPTAKAGVSGLASLRLFYRRELPMWWESEGYHRIGVRNEGTTLAENVEVKLESIEPVVPFQHNVLPSRLGRKGGGTEDCRMNPGTVDYFDILQEVPLDRESNGPIFTVSSRGPRSLCLWTVESAGQVFELNPETAYRWTITAAAGNVQPATRVLLVRHPVGDHVQLELT